MTPVRADRATGLMEGYPMHPQQPSYDLASPTFLANPYPTWAQMRAEVPVYQDADGE